VKILLSLFILAGVALLTLDSGAYFSEVRGSLYLGYGFAGVMESSILALAFFPNRTGDKSRFVKPLIAGLYLISVASAGLTIARPALKNLESSRHLSLLESKHQALEKELLIFRNQSQKRNTAMTATRLAEVRDELLDLSRNQTKAPFWNWLEIGIAFSSRLFLQLSVVFLTGLLGRWERLAVTVKKTSFDQPVKPVKTTAEPSPAVRSPRRDQRGRFVGK